MTDEERMIHAGEQQLALAQRDPAARGYWTFVTGKPPVDRPAQPSLEDCDRYLAAHYAGQRRFFVTPEAIRAAHAVAREAERVRAIRMSLGSRTDD